MDFKFLNVFNKKQKQVQSSNAMLTQDRIGKMGGFLGQIYSFLTDDGESFDIVKTLTKARNYAISDPIVISFIRCMKNNVVGHTGFTLQSKFSAFDIEKNAYINTKIETEWYNFTKAGNFDISGRYNIIDFLQLALQQYIVDGEAVIRIYKTGKYGIQLQLMQFDSIDYNMNEANIINGVEIDGYTKPIAYWIKGHNTKSVRVPAEEIIHLVNTFDVAKYRGISFLAPVLPLIKDINTYRKAEITAAINEATSVLTYESDKDYGRAYEGAATVADLANFKPGSKETAPANTGENILKAFENSSVRVGGLAIEALPPGVRLNQLSSNHPSSSSPEFQKSFYKALAAGLGVSYLTLMLDLDASTYSGSRATALLERPTYKRFRATLIDQILERIYQLWLPSVLRKYSADMPKVENMYEAYYEHEFMALGFDYINPKDEADAQVVAIQNGLVTYTSVLAERGIDLEDHLKTIQSEQEKMAKYGISLGQYAQKQAEKPVETAQNKEELAQKMPKKVVKRLKKKPETIKEDDEITVINGD